MGNKHPSAASTRDGSPAASVDGSGSPSGRNGSRRRGKSESAGEHAQSTSSNPNSRLPADLQSSHSQQFPGGLGEPVSPNTLAQHFSQLFGSQPPTRTRTSNSSSSQNNAATASAEGGTPSAAASQLTRQVSGDPHSDFTQFLNAMFGNSNGTSSSSQRSFFSPGSSSGSRPRIFERNGALFAFVNGRVVQLQAPKTCQYCNKQINPFQEEFDLHVVKCMTKPRIKSVTFEVSNSDTDLLEEDLECTICFEQYKLGQMCARLECFCVFHKGCLDSWLSRKQCCPLHMKEED